MLCLLLAAALAAAAEAEDAVVPVGDVASVEPVLRWTGRTVVQRSLVAPEGGLPDESLESLLRLQVDQPYRPIDVRDDIAMLHRVLEVARVEVDVEEWPGFDADGQPIVGVKVEYRVWPPPRVHRVRFSGNRVLSDRALRAVTGVEPGRPFFADDATALERAVREAYVREGYLRAAVVVTALADAEQRLDVDVLVTEGEPQRLQAVVVRDGGALPAARVRAILARNGLAVGRPWTESRVTPAREALLDVLRARGWWGARVGVRMEAAGPTEDRLVIIVDPRQRWRLELVGKGLPRPGRVLDRLGVREGAQIGRDFADAAAQVVRSELLEDGWPAAEVRASLVERARGRTGLRIKGSAGARHVLRRVRFEGDTVFGEDYLEDALREASPDVLTRGRVTEGAVDDALVLVQEFFRAEGYLGARLERTAYVTEPRGRMAAVDVTVRVTPGPRAVLRHLRFTGEALPEGMDAEARFADLVGAPYNPAAAEARARQLVEALAELGHLDADARVRAVLAEDGTAVDVAVEVVPGPVVYLRTAVLRGYRRTQRGVLMREVDLRPGEPISPSRLADMRRRLYELDVFTRVDLDLQGDEDRVKDLLIRVEEKPNLHFEVGGGVATDRGATVFARAGHRNLFGLGHRVTGLAQAGLGWVGDGWALDVVAPVWRAAARYEAPNLPGRGERLALDLLFNERAQEPTFRLERTGAAASARLRLGASDSASVAYRVQARRLMDVDPGAFVNGDPWLDEIGIDVLDDDPHPTTPSDFRFQSGFEVSAVHDRRDDPFNPSRGSLGSIVLMLTDRLASDTVFLKAEGSWTQWAPVGTVGLMLRGRAGVGWVPGGESTLPLEERFRLGGGSTMRGFDLDTVGPANSVSRERVEWPDALGPIIDYAGRDDGARWVPTGGDTMGLLSAELRLPFERMGLDALSGSQLALFSDVGNVWFLDELAAPGSAATDPLLRWSVGLGVRRTTAIGPVEVDVGFNPARLPDRGEELVRLHVSLGAQ